MEQVPKDYRSRSGQETNIPSDKSDPLPWSVIYGFVTGKNVTRIVVIIGLLATLFPWYLSDTFQFGGPSQNLFLGLMAAENLGLEFGALLFYVGLLMVYFHTKVWSFVGGLVMGFAIVVSAGSIQGYRAWGAGAYLGLLVVLFAFLPVLDFFISMGNKDPIVD